jgi:hypothetical protein
MTSLPTLVESTDTSDPLEGQPGQTINLVNPVSDHFGPFIVNNAFAWQSRALMALEPFISPEAFEALKGEFVTVKPSMYYGASKLFHDLVDRHLDGQFMVKQDSAKGQHLVLCGAGPSLNDHAAEWTEKADQVWGCNSALTWLAKSGHRVTHGFAVDQTESLVDEWRDAPSDVDYLIASTVNPKLVQFLETEDRQHRFFHNFVGLPGPAQAIHDDNGVFLEVMQYEDWLYANLFPASVRCGAGLNAVTRAIELGVYMGFAKITVLGADCALRVKRRCPWPAQPTESKAFQKWLRRDTVMHADGGNALASGATAVVLNTTIDAGTPDETIRLANGATTTDASPRFWKGEPPSVTKKGPARYWSTKPDMVMSAQWLVRMARAMPGTIELIGDTLPNALMGKNEAYLRRLPNFVDAQGRLANIPQYDPAPGTANAAV